MGVETLSQEEIDQIMKENLDASEEAEIPIKEKSLDEYKDVLKEAKTHRLDSVEDISKFFAEREKEEKLVFSADCRKDIVQIIKDEGMKFLENNGVVSESEKQDLEWLIGEIIKDAITHTQNSEKYQFIVKIKFDPNNPHSFSFLVINPCNIPAEKFSEQEKDTGLGNIMKASLAKNLKAEISHLDINSANKKIFHGFEFAR